MDFKKSKSIYLLHYVERLCYTGQSVLWMSYDCTRLKKSTGAELILKFLRHPSNPCVVNAASCFIVGPTKGKRIKTLLKCKNHNYYYFVKYSQSRVTLSISIQTYGMLVVFFYLILQ